jgi:hypothetical protein
VLFSEKDLSENYFSKYFGGEFFNVDATKNCIYKGNIENNKNNLTNKEYVYIISIVALFSEQNSKYSRTF